MKIYNNIRGAFCAVLSMLFALSVSAQQLTVLHVNDTHSHIEASAPARRQDSEG